MKSQSLRPNSLAVNGFLEKSLSRGSSSLWGSSELVPAREDSSEALVLIWLCFAYFSMVKWYKPVKLYHFRNFETSRVHKHKKSCKSDIPDRTEDNLYRRWLSVTAFIAKGLMLVLVIPQLKLQLFLFLTWEFILFLVLLWLFSNKSYLWRSQEMQDLLHLWLGRSWSWSRHW